MKISVISLIVISIFLSGLFLSCALHSSLYEERGVANTSNQTFTSIYKPANTEGSATTRSTFNMESTVNKVGMALIRAIPANLTLCVVNVSPNSDQMADFAVEELKFRLAESQKFKVLDEKASNSMRIRQRNTNEVNEASAISLGQMVGANIVITVSITRTGLRQILSVKALDSRTAQIVAMVHETI